MNTELKLLLKTGCEAFVLGKDALAKKDLGTLVVDGEKLFTDIPAVVAGWSGLQAEIQALAGSEAEQDLAAYLMSDCIPTITDNAKAVKVVGCVLTMVMHVVNDALAVKAALEA